MTTAPRLSADERRVAIVDAALQEFAAHGFEKATTDAVARRAGISQPYVIRLFGSKRAVFEAALDRAFTAVEDAFADAAAGAGEGDPLQAMGAAYGRLLEDRTLLMMLLQAFAASGDDHVKAVVRERMAGLRARVAELSGATPDRLREFFAMGMLLNVVAALELPELLGGPDWTDRMCQAL
ncbi:MAG: helix-turn-helix domain-containing protein [Thermoleophilia bacterium]